MGISKGKGQDLVEFAIVLPILAFIIFMIFDLGRAVYYFSAVTNAAREGARYGVVDPTNTNKIIDTACHFSTGLDQDCPSSPGVGIQVSLIDEDGFTNKYEIIKVIVSYDFEPVTPGAGLLLGLNQGQSFKLSSQSLMRIEN